MTSIAHGAGSPMRLIRALSLVLLAVAMAGCGGGAGSSPAGAVTVTSGVAVTPASVKIAVGGVAHTFVATVTGASASGVTWQVNGIEGGDTSVGTISPAGQYVSPPSLPANSTVTIQAVSVADPTVSGAASVELTTAAADTGIVVTPGSAIVAVGGSAITFSAEISSGGGSAVTWEVNGSAGGDSTVGTISAAGVYTPPASAPAQAAVTITAVSTSDSTLFGSVTVTLTSVSAGSPAISGEPGTSVTVGMVYQFIPTATSPIGAPLYYVIANKPSWANFNGTTGELSGTPGPGDVGPYANVTIAASDGTVASSLPPFTISVRALGTGTATLSWTEPAERTDGSALTNLAGYRVYFGTSRGYYPNVIDVPSPSALGYEVTGLASGTYYFVASAYDSDGNESPYTPAASKTIP